MKLILLLLLSVNIAQANERNLQLRVERLERMMTQNSDQQFLPRLRMLQQENQELRELIEQQSYQYQQLQKKMRSLYEDMDRRVMTLETAENQPLSPTANTATPESVQQPSNDVASPVDNSAAAPAQDMAKQTQIDEEIGYQEQIAYQKAFNALKGMHYGQAEAAFTSFLGVYPEGEYAHLAQYWLAESVYVQRKFNQALAYYQKITEKYPESPKAPDAWLKTGICYFETGNIEKARKIFSQIMQNYPATTVANQAENILKRIQ